MATTRSSSSNILHDDPQALFASIYEKFKNALPKDIQKDFVGLTKSSDMLAKFDQLVKDSTSRSGNTQRIMKAPAKLVDRLGPYFEVMNIYVQSHPEYAALVWGSLRFILLIAKNYTTFLAKVENALVRMMNTLPNFEAFLREVRNCKAIIPTGIIPGLVQAMAWIYGDILTFCHRLCTILQPQQKGALFKLKLFNNMTLKPFDAHFAEILESFELHSSFFEDLMGNTSAIMALQFHDRWKSQMEKTQKSLNQIQDQQHLQEKENNESALIAAIAELQRRVGASTWAATFEHARSHRIEDSGEWLLDHPLMVQRLAESRQNLNSKETNVFILYGKPGYGKTTLATVVIDHLRNMASSRGPNNSDSLAFFFFDRQSRYSSSHDACRALLAQLIFSRRFDQIVLDIAALARPDHDTGQQVASDNEVFAILHLFLLQFTSCTFVCDGVDECTNRDDFLTKLSRLAADHKDCQFLLFSRPIIKIPKELQKCSSFLEMDHTQNFQDISSYVAPQIMDLIEDGELILSKVTSVDDITMSICNRSNGMFLWAALFLGYLKLPSLSRSQRREAIEDSTKFDGLYSLYDSIIAYIDKEYPKLSRRNIRRAISWVLGAFQPLEVSELQAAIAQMDDRSIIEADFIPNFEKSIGPMTGALIEITKDKTVRLIHMTVAEYLLSTSETIDPSFCDETVLDFKAAVVQYYLTKTCLAYMLHTAPIGPYAGRYSEDSDFASTCKEYPLLSYASRFWTTHLQQVTVRITNFSSANSMSIFEQLGQLTLSFLSDKLKFTSWTEALWHMGCPSEAWAMESVDMKDTPSISTTSNVRAAASLLHIAFKENAELMKSWGNVLSKFPEELWLPSISAFSKSKLRKISTAAETSSILSDSTHSKDSIILQTKCSSSGHTIGILKAHYQSPATNYTYRSDAPADASPLIVTYEVRSLNDGGVLFETSLSVPSRDIRMIMPEHMLNRMSTLYQRKVDEFSIETTISPSLMEVVIGSTLIKLLVEVESSGPRFKCTKHVLEFLRDNSGFTRPTSAGVTWKLFLSHGAEFLLLLRRHCDPDGCRIGRSCTVDIFQDPMCRRNSLKPKFTWVAWKIIIDPPNTKGVPLQNPSWIEPLSSSKEFDLQLSNLHSEPPQESDNPAEKLVHPPDSSDYDEPVLQFHPTLPQIVYSDSTGTFLWNFCSLLHSTIHKVQQEHVQIYKSALSNIRIADSGNLLHGFELVDGKERVAILDLRQYQRVFGTPITATMKLQILDSTKSVVQHLIRFNHGELLREASSQAQPSNSAMLVQGSSGAPALSILRRSKTDGSLVQETFDSQGNTKARTLLHLPRSISEAVDITLLRPGECGSQKGPDGMKVLLGVQPKSSYSFKEGNSATAAGTTLPIIYQRDQSSIRTIEGGMWNVGGTPVVELCDASDSK